MGNCDTNYIRNWFFNNSNYLCGDSTYEAGITKKENIEPEIIGK